MKLPEHEIGQFYSCDSYVLVMYYVHPPDDEDLTDDTDDTATEEEPTGHKGSSGSGGGGGIGSFKHVKRRFGV